MEHTEMEARRERPSVFAAAALVLISVAGLWASSFLVSEALSEADAAQSFWMDLAYYGPFVLLPTLIYCLRRRGLSDALRLNPLPVMPTLMIGFIALMSVYLASAVNGLWGLLLTTLGLPQVESTLMVGNSRELMLAVLHSAAIPAVCEELLYRGVLFSAFEGRGTALAVGVSSVLFGLAHGNLYGLPAYVLVGAISAFIVFAVDSLYAGMFYHTVYNAAVLVLVYLISQQTSVDADAAIDGAMAASLAFDMLVTGVSLSLLLTALNFRRKAMGIQAVPRTREPLAGREWAMLIALCIALVVTIVAVLLLAEVPA